MTDASVALTRFLAIRRERALKVVGSALSWMAVGQVLFAAFALGTAQGPVPLRAVEMIWGIVAALSAGLAFSILTRRRRLESGARSVFSVREGRHKRRVAVFDDYFTIDREVVLLGSVESVEVKERSVVLRHRDPRFGGHLLRELAFSSENEAARMKRFAGSETSTQEEAEASASSGEKD